MGGHTIYPGGLVIDMLPFNHMEFDEDRELLHVADTPAGLLGQLAAAPRVRVDKWQKAREQT